MRRRSLVRALAVLAAGAQWPVAAAAQERQSLRGLLGARGSEGFAQAIGARVWRFPADNGPHPDFRTEWWYFTGNLATRGGRAFGFELVFFRFALSPKPVRADSQWAGRQVYMAHFALSDIAGRKFHAAERLSRTGPGLAGARAPFRVWLDDWRAAGETPEGFPLRLQARTEAVAIDLRVQGGKPPVLEGPGGLSRKGPRPGQASYYYSRTRMPTDGKLRAGRRWFDVQGEAWLDREWSSGALPAGVAGWDWFGLQLDDRRELMVYRLRRRDGSPDPFSSGTFVATDGQATHLDAAAFAIEVLGRWRSPADGVRYPSRWRIIVPALALRLEVESRLPDQELRLMVRYWEGSVSVAGDLGGHPVAGLGYAELTGYGPVALPG